MRASLVLLAMAAACGRDPAPVVPAVVPVADAAPARVDAPAPAIDGGVAAAKPACLRSPVEIAEEVGGAWVIVLRGEPGRFERLQRGHLRGRTSRGAVAGSDFQILRVTADGDAYAKVAPPGGAAGDYEAHVCPVVDDQPCRC